MNTVTSKKSDNAGKTITMLLWLLAVLDIAYILFTFGDNLYGSARADLFHTILTINCAMAVIATAIPLTAYYFKKVNMFPKTMFAIIPYILVVMIVMIGITFILFNSFGISY